MAVKKAAARKQAVVKQVAKAAGVLTPERKPPERPAVRTPHVQLGFQLNNGFVQKIRGSGDFRATTLNGSIPIPTGPKRIGRILREFHVVDTVALREHGIAIEVAVRFRSL